MKKFIALKDNLQRIFHNDKNVIKTVITKRDNVEAIINYYEGFFTITLKEITIFYFLDNSKVKPFNDFIEVTGNKKYKIENIIKGEVIKTNIVIEGADGVGKSTLVKELYLTQDRAVKQITQKMRQEIPVEERIGSVKKYLNEDKERKVIFLYLSDEKVLKNRVEGRENISEYDKKALIFQRLYVDTYNHLKDYNNLHIIDCLGKSPIQLALEIEKMI